MQQVKKPKKPLIFYYCVVLLVMVLLNTIVVPSLLKTQIKEVDYGTFLTMLNDKEVDTAQVENDVIYFTDKAEKQQPMTLLEKDFLEESGISIDSGEKKSYNG